MKNLRLVSALLIVLGLNACTWREVPGASSTLATGNPSGSSTGTSSGNSSGTTSTGMGGATLGVTAPAPESLVAFKSGSVLGYSKIEDDAMADPVALVQGVPSTVRPIGIYKFPAEGKNVLLLRDDSAPYNELIGMVLADDMQRVEGRATIKLALEVPSFALLSAVTINEGYVTLIFRDTTTGQTSFAEIAGLSGQVIKSGYLGTAVPMHWEIVSMRDIDGNGTPDLIWHDLQSGTVAVWYMNGMTPARQTAMTGSSLQTLLGTYVSGGETYFLWFDPAMQKLGTWIVGRDSEVQRAFFLGGAADELAGATFP